jgi:hypothetical protein
VERIVGSLPLTISGRLGREATDGLAEFLESEQRDWSKQVLTLAANGFERRLGEEVANLRVEVAALASAIRQEIAKHRFELLKWMFVFWVGQIAAVSAILGFVLRH